MLVGSALALWLGIRVWTSLDRTSKPTGPVYRAFNSDAMVADGPLISPPAQSTQAGVQLPAAALPVREPNLSERLRKIDWFQSEKLVAVLFRARGYSVEENGGAKEDDGADLIVRRNGELTIVQCKHWRTWDVNKAIVFQLVGAKQDWQAGKAVMVSLNGLTGPAGDLAKAQGIESADERQLVAWLEELRFTPTWPQIETCLDAGNKLCPKCGAVMMQRTDSKGANAGGHFWGCTNYPRCDSIIR